MEVPEPTGSPEQHPSPVLKSCLGALRIGGLCRVLLALPWSNPGNLGSGVFSHIRGVFERRAGGWERCWSPRSSACWLSPASQDGSWEIFNSELSAEGKFSTRPEHSHAGSAVSHGVEVNRATTNSAPLEGEARLCRRHRKVCACCGMATALLLHPQSRLESSEGSSINPANPRAWKPRQLLGRVWAALSSSLSTSSPGNSALGNPGVTTFLSLPNLCISPRSLQQIRAADRAGAHPTPGILGCAGVPHPPSQRAAACSPPSCLQLQLAASSRSGRAVPAADCKFTKSVN